MSSLRNTNLSIIFKKVVSVFKKAILLSIKQFTFRRSSFIKAENFVKVVHFKSLR